MKYAIIDGNNKVRGFVQTNVLQNHSDKVDVTDRNVEIGQVYDSSTDSFFTPINYELKISADKTNIAADGSDTVTVTGQIYYDGVLSSNFDGQAMYIPVVGIDGVQHDLLKVSFSGGETTVTWNTTKKGIYTVRLDLVRPETNIDLQSNIEIIAE